MPDYSKAKIYAIRSHQTEKIYIGATLNRLSVRLSQHKGHYRRWKAGKIKKDTTAVEILQYDDCYIELLEKCPCVDKDELNAIEARYIREMDCVNRNVPGRTRKEWREEHKENIAAQKKEYYEANKEQCAAQRKKWYEANKERRSEKITCECGSVICRDGLKAHKRTKKHQAYEAAAAVDESTAELAS